MREIHFAPVQCLVFWRFCRSLFSEGYFLGKGRGGGSGNVSDTLQKALGCHGEFSYFKVVFQHQSVKILFGTGLEKLKCGKLLILNLLTLTRLYWYFQAFLQN